MYILQQASTAKYILQQYIAATGGQTALQSLHSMYAIGKVKMSASEFHMGDQSVQTASNKQGEIGGFVLWQKTPDLWYFELIMAGCKMSAGSDGKVAWRQSASEQSHASRGPPRPMRRSLQVYEYVINDNKSYDLDFEARIYRRQFRTVLDLRPELTNVDHCTCECSPYRVWTRERRQTSSRRQHASARR